MRPFLSYSCWLLCALLIVVAPSPCRAQKALPAATPAIAKPGAGESPTKTYFTDLILTNQNGEKMRLYSDLLKGHVVIIHPFFSTCTGSCSSLVRNMQKIQDALGEKVGREVFLISITVDPTVDTPTLLSSYAKKWNAKAGWYFLSGDQANVELALRKLGQYVDDKQNHSNIFIIGNERTGLWKKALGLAQTDDLMKVIESVINDKKDTPPGTASKSN